MSNPTLHVFIGANITASLVIALFFLRFWFRTRDRLFAIFATAFVLLAVCWGEISMQGWTEGHAGLYLIRLVAFLLIIAAIVDKNRNRSRSIKRE